MIDVYKRQVERHISEFEKMAAVLHGYTETCVISFISISCSINRSSSTFRSSNIYKTELCWEMCIRDRFGFERAFGKTNGIENSADTDTKITKFGISFNSDGCLLYTSA